MRRGVRIVWNPTTLAIGSGTTWHVVAIGDVVGLGVAGSARQVVSRSGCSIDVDPRHFRGTDALVAHLDQRIDAALRFPDDRGPTPVRHG